MAWDTEGTKNKLLAAAVDEFAERGIAGGRVDRVAASARVNKERIYQYFGGKEGLFEAVLDQELVRVGDEVPLPSPASGVEGVLGYADALLVRHRSDSRLARLLLWEALERGKAVALERRAVQSADKAAALVAAHPLLTVDAAAGVLLTILTLANAWATLGNLVDAVDRTEPQLRAMLRSIVRALLPAD